MPANKELVGQKSKALEAQSLAGVLRAKRVAHEAARGDLGSLLIGARQHGHLDDWIDNFKAAAQFPNVFCKLSGMVTEVRLVRHTKFMPTLLHIENV